MTAAASRQDDGASRLADQIMVKIADQVNSFDAVYSGLCGASPRAGWLLRPAGLPQSVRIKVGDEPANLYDHIRHSARMRRFFNSGVSVFPAEPTAERSGTLSLTWSSHSIDDRISRSTAPAWSSITGFLAKRSEMKKFQSGDVTSQDTARRPGQLHRQPPWRSRFAWRPSGRRAAQS